MDMADQISKLQVELEEAETDLQQSLSEVNQRVEAAALRPRVEDAIKRHPVAAVCAGAAAGFVIGGGESKLALAGALALGIFLGFKFGSEPHEGS